MDRDPDPVVEALRGHAPPNNRALAKDVLDQLRTVIVRGQLEPGTHLREAPLAQAFGVSRGPIREAFVALQREGLVTLHRQRGARVTKLSQVDIAEIYQLRRALELLAIRRAIASATEADLSSLDERLDALRHAVLARNLPAAVEADVQFHDAIYQAAHQGRLYSAWSALRPQIETFLYSRAYKSGDYLAKAIPEHTDLRDVIRQRALSEATRMLSEHLRTSYERLRISKPYDSKRPTR